MKLQPLDLEDISEWLEKQIEKRDDLIIRKKINPSNPPLFKEIVYITKIRDILIDEIKQRLKSACEFWLKYKDNPLLLCEEKPEYKKEFEPFTTAFKSSAFSSQKLKWILDKYNDWLFRLCFKSVLEDDKK